MTFILETRKTVSALLSGAGEGNSILLYASENPKAKSSRQNRELKSSLDDTFKDPGSTLGVREAHVSVECGLLIATPANHMNS